MSPNTMSCTTTGIHIALWETQIQMASECTGLHVFSMRWAFVGIFFFS